MYLTDSALNEYSVGQISHHRFYFLFCLKFYEEVNNSLYFASQYRYNSIEFKSSGHLFLVAAVMYLVDVQSVAARVILLFYI